jgi:hypothetical protein
MKLTNYNQEERRLPSGSELTDKLSETTPVPQRASNGKRLSLSVLCVAGLGAMTYLTGCDVTVREPGVVVTPPVVQVETPTVAVEAPAVTVEAPAVVLEEGVAVVPPVGVEFVLMGGRYAWFEPGIGRWYYRPMAWRPPAGYHAREVRSMRELEAIHRSDMRRGPGARPDARRPEPRKEMQKQEQKKQEMKQQQKQEQKKQQPKKQEKKKEEK